MKLWILRPKGWYLEEDYRMQDGSPWRSWWDMVHGSVVRAASEEEARSLAPTGDEDRSQYPARPSPNPWLDPAWTTCIELLPDGDPGEVIEDYHAGG